MAPSSALTPADFDHNCRRVSASWPTWPDPLIGEVAERALASARITFVSAAEWRWEEGRSVPRRRLPTSTIAWYLKGSGRLRLAGATHAIVSPAVQCIPAGLWHDVRHDRGQPLDSISVHYQAPLPAGGELAEVLGLPTLLPVAGGIADQPLLTALSTMARLDALRPVGWRLLAQAELVRALMHLVLTRGSLCRTVPVSVVSLPSRLASVLARIEQELPTGPIRIEELATTAGISAVHLRTLFRRVTGMAPHRYVQQRRVALASRLLRERDDPIADIAQAVGVPDLRVFRRLFKAITGSTPMRWRMEM